MKQIIQTTIFLVLFIFFHPTYTQAENKWIVVTTINPPTKAIKQFAQLPDWHVVVIADKKTPLDWHCPGIDFLSVEKQKQLNFKIIKLLPENHYSRKSIGYLYAINKGATVIYETDDDNLLLNNNIQYLPSSSDKLLCSDSQPIINPYSYFGQPTVWPRGYPLTQVLQTKRSQTNEQIVTPLIQEILVNGDPDVDAIFRLTRQEAVTFNKEPNILCLPAGTMSPFNTQSTIFHRQAFWGLLIPMTVPFRACDIWRGYVTQRLLWEIGSNLSFLPPQIEQVRNEHNLLKDFIGEIELYTQAEKFIQFLLNWKPHKTKIAEQQLELIDALIDAGFYQPKERELTIAWLDDLRSAGYQFPQPPANQDN